MKWNSDYIFFAPKKDEYSKSQIRCLCKSLMKIGFILEIHHSSVSYFFITKFITSCECFAVKRFKNILNYGICWNTLSTDKNCKRRWALALDNKSLLGNSCGFNFVCWGKNTIKNIANVINWTLLFDRTVMHLKMWKCHPGISQDNRNHLQFFIHELDKSHFAGCGNHFMS